MGGWMRMGRAWLVIFSIGLLLAWLIWMPSPKEPGYRFVLAWGGAGKGPALFQDPTGIALSGNEVFVSDSRNGRIQVFDFEGRFKRAFGQGILGRPMNLAYQNGVLYVADFWHDKLWLFGVDGKLQRAIGRSGQGAGEFDSPAGVAVGPDGDIYVADFYNQRIQRLHQDGEFVRQWGKTGKIGIWAGQFNYPTAVAVARDGTLFVADGYNDRIQVFSAEGAFRRKWGGPFAVNIFGPFPGWFATVTGVTLDSDGCVYVADFYNHRVQKFTAGGRFLTAFGEYGQAPGQFDRAMAVAVAASGEVFVVDHGNQRIQKWQKKDEQRVSYRSSRCSIGSHR